MYRVYTIQDTVRVDPSMFEMGLENAITRILRDKYERRIDRDMGVILAVWNPMDISDGRVILGDGASYHQLTFNALAYTPENNEVVETEVNEIVEFGAFVKLGPMDGLVHLSQITNEFLSFDKKIPAFIGKESKKSLKKGDVVYAKISTISMKRSIADTKIGLTMRPEGLGRDDWAKSKKASTGKGKKSAPKKGAK